MSRVLLTAAFASLVLAGCGGPSPAEQRAAKIDYCIDFVAAPLPVQIAFTRRAYVGIVKVLREQYLAAEHPDQLKPVLSAPLSPSATVTETVRTRLIAECSSPHAIPEVQLVGAYLDGKYAFP